MLSLAGCVGMPVLPDGGSGSDGGDGGSGSGNGGSPTPIRAELVVSNSIPSEGEEVDLECVVTPTPEAALTFSFEPDDELIVDQRRGTATLIVQSTDIGVTLSFRCSATDGDGLSVRSPARSIIPSR